MRAILPAIVLLATAALSDHARAQPYVMHPFGIPGATSVSVAAINDSGIAVGSYVSPSQPHGAGFVGHCGAVSTMALAGQPTANFPQGYIPVPTSINNLGVVLGMYPTGSFPDQGTELFQEEIFAWRDRAYLATIDESVVSKVQLKLLPPPYIGTDNWFCLNEGGPQMPTMPRTGRFPSKGSYLPIFNANVNNVNAQGVAVGIFFSVYTLAPGQTQLTATSIIPPGGKYSSGGWINDANQVAGSYEDKGGELHGFVYLNGNYTTFDMPVRPDTLTTQGIDQSGRAVGVYTKGVTQTAFVYANAVVTRLKPFPLNDTVHVAISHFGKFIAISDTNVNGVARSWNVAPAPLAD